MIAVIFEVWPADGERQSYFARAAALRADLAAIDGSFPWSASRA